MQTDSFEETLFLNHHKRKHPLWMIVLARMERGCYGKTAMKVFSPLIGLILSVACVLTGCQTNKGQPPSDIVAAGATRNNCYSLLHDLLNDEKNVSLIRFIKREQEDVRNLIKKIATASGAGAKMLEDFAKRDPSIKLDDTLLPPGEVATREAIASTRKKELLSQNGAEFERSLLLTQAEALSYALHLAKVAAENEIQPDRARSVAALGEEMKNLYQEVIGLLSKTNSPATTPTKKSWLRGLFK
jgi:hypothetical protein